MAGNKNNVASVLAYEKKLVPSDGFMYGTTWPRRKDVASPLKLIEKSLRGTISNRLKKSVSDDPMKLNAEVEKPNLQRVDSCSLDTDQDTLKLQFTLKVLSGVQNPSACNNVGFNESVTNAVESYIREYDFSELATRYAINLANARFLWRNRVGAEKIEVEVKVLNESDSQTWTFDAGRISTRHFDISSPDISTLSQKIADALAGRSQFLLLEINAYAQVGKAQIVYPSEELVLDKSGNDKDGKSKVLYSINGIAGMHSQKIGNAIRTIDTWYPEYDPSSSMPIAIEPYGAVTNLGRAYRNPKANADFYTLFDRFARGEKLNQIDEAHYVIACLVRGGVFGESSKE